MAPAFPPGLGGSLPSAYQFVRDPQSGQLVVIPSDHLPHFGKWWPCGGGAVAVVALPGEPDPDAKGLLGGQASAQNNGVGVRPGLLGDVLMSGASPGSNAMVVPVLMGSYSEPKQAAPSWGLAPLPWPPCPGASHSMGVHLVDHRVRWEEELGVPACGRGPPWAGDGARVPWAGDGEGGTEAPLPVASASPCVEGGGGHGLTVRPVPSGADGAGRGAPPLGRPVPAGPRRPAPRPAATALLPAAPPAAA